MREEDRRRIERLLEEDKEEMNAATNAAAVRDFTRVAAEYFELSEEVRLEIARERKGFSVKISFRASRVKNFTPLGHPAENR